MKKAISLLLIVAVVCSMGISAFATNDYTAGTQVEYVGQGAESYTVTVPALMAPGDEGTVTLSGTWASNQTVKVTADATVTLANSINAADTHTLDVTFAGIEEAGDNTESKTYTETVAVAAMPADALFGTWSGTFEYQVEYVESTTLKTLDILDGLAETATPWITITYEEGMTWGEWLESEYNSDTDWRGYYDESMGLIIIGDMLSTSDGTSWEDREPGSYTTLDELIDSSKLYSTSP